MTLASTGARRLALISFGAAAVFPLAVGLLLAAAALSEPTASAAAPSGALAAAWSAAWRIGSAALLCFAPAAAANLAGAGLGLGAALVPGEPGWRWAGLGAAALNVGWWVAAVLLVLASN